MGQRFALAHAVDTKRLLSVPIRANPRLKN